MVGIRVLANIVYGALVGALHLLLVGLVVIVIWSYKEPIAATSLTVAEAFFHAVYGFVVWMGPIAGNAALWLLSTFWAAIVSIFLYAKALVAALWILAIGSPPDQKEPTLVNQPTITLPEATSTSPKSQLATILETPVSAVSGSTAVVKFAVFPSSWCWKEASPEPVECTAPQSKAGGHAFSEALREANQALLDAKRLVIIGVASCDGSSQARNEQLAIDRAKQLEAMVKGINRTERIIIVLTLGQFIAKDCITIGQQDRARQRPIVIAGVYADQPDEITKSYIIEALRKTPQALPQVESYSKKDIVP